MSSVSPRLVLQRVRDIIVANPSLSVRYNEAKQVVRTFRKPAFYEVTQRCNLKCEGCYYFETDFVPVSETVDLAAWQAFFAAESCRQVSMVYFVGAEPALEQDRLFAAAQYFEHGNVGTNGITRIDPAIPFRIAVSVWGGDDAIDRMLRGSVAFRKAFKNYAGDPRAIIYYTLSELNLETARVIAEMCRDHGLPLTFNMYSPTNLYLDKLSLNQVNDDRFFRIGRPDKTPCFSPEGLMRARQIVDDLMERFPETIVYSKAYNDWITEPGPRYYIEPSTGLATGCGSRIDGTMSYYGADLLPMTPKCCTSAIDCSMCRMLSGGWSSKLQPNEDDVHDDAAFSRWLDLIGVLDRIFIYRNAKPISAIFDTIVPLPIEHALSPTFA